MKGMRQQLLWRGMEQRGSPQGQHPHSPRQSRIATPADSSTHRETMRGRGVLRPQCSLYQRHKVTELGYLPSYAALCQQQQLLPLPSLLQ